MDSLSLVLIFVITTAAVFTGTGVLLPFLRARAILDLPNERSSHDVPTPKGGGIVVIGVGLAAWVGVGFYFDAGAFLTWVVPAGALLLAGLSWIDDLRGLTPIVRLVAQITAVVAMLMLRPDSEPFFQGLLPGFLDALLAGVLWVWFINLFNFMDGIDGITGVETLVIGVGIGLTGGAMGVYGIILAGAALGFLKWNWHPAKVFMGDVGSVPLGFLLGWLLLDLAGSGHWAAALILPGYYLADATTTLLRRAVKGEKVWQPHRQHFYQQAVQRGLSHAMVAAGIALLGSLLVNLAWQANHGWAMPALAVAIVLSFGFLVLLAGGFRR
ncbi:MAG: glycosyltransferase family 4 protein [Rhodospirillaceae bacterium]|jgi:UDP-N-acetylmuramyl pentapeptide phosphotransferase/UDP-N-acetylglucosamine-1-phosphate transferase|nr:glycosyltransferase family 4 protein [Rhodospirillaceae bacterium]